MKCISLNFKYIFIPQRRVRCYFTSYKITQLKVVYKISLSRVTCKLTKKISINKVTFSLIVTKDKCTYLNHTNSFLF